MSRRNTAHPVLALVRFVGPAPGALGLILHCALAMALAFSAGPRALWSGFGGHLMDSQCTGGRIQEGVVQTF